MMRIGYKVIIDLDEDELLEKKKGVIFKWLNKIPFLDKKIQAKIKEEIKKELKRNLERELPADVDIFDMDESKLDYSWMFEEEE